MSLLNASLVWFRRDLRIDDHAALYHALKMSRQVYAVFIYDRAILDALLASGLQADRRVEFIQRSLTELDAALRTHGGGLIVRHASADTEIPAMAAALGVEAVFCNHDYEPQAIERDSKVSAALMAADRSLLSYKDQAIFEKDEVLSQAGKPFSVFTPYKNAWLKQLATRDDDFYLKAYPVASYLDRLAAPPAAYAQPLPSLAELGFAPTNLMEIGIPPGMSGARALLETFKPGMPAYTDRRNFPALPGTSRLSVHLRFGTISVRELAAHALNGMRASGNADGAATWLSELIWRDFYFMILYHHPRVATQAFKPEYDRIAWRQDDEGDALFQAWCDGRTGYPLVDAAMLQLNQTGFMHNRLRMVTACFLMKDLGIDWRRGERYFADRLNDYDLSANNGGWQWASSSGCDAQPYFRIFNPVTQSEKFDPEGNFIRQYLPQLARLNRKQIHAPWLLTTDTLKAAGIHLGGNYPRPVVKHDEAREQTLARYGVVRKISTEPVEG